MTSRRRFATHPLLVVAVIFAALPFVFPAAGMTLSLATEVIIYTLYAMGFNLLLGYIGLVSFGASAYFGVASYAAGLAFLRLFGSVVPSVLFGTIFAGLLGLVLGALILRRRGVYFSLLTLAFTQLFYEIAFTWTDFTGGENGLQGIRRPGLGDEHVFYAFTAIITFMAILCLWRLVHSPFGRVLQAIRDNEQRTRCLGYDTHGYKLAAFTLSSLFIGLAGSLLTFLIQSVYADNLNWQHAGDPVMMTILGGIHYFLGPLWGSIIFISLRDQLSFYTEHWWIFFGAVLIALILLSPEGLSGIYERLRGSRRWALTRTRIPPRPQVLPALRHSVRRASNDGVVLVVEALNKSFGSLVVANDIHLRVRAGDLHSLIGPNGAGKTTFFNMLTGLLSSNSGRIAFLGKDVTALPPHRRVDGGLARSFQIVSVYKDLTVFETVRLAAQAHSPYRASVWRDAYALPEVNERAWALLAMVGLEERAPELCANLAHGEQRLLEIAVTLATDPEMLLLDEPLAGLGDADREHISRLIRQLAGERTVLLIEHDIDRVLAISDRISVLHQGAIIAEGTPQEIASHPEVVAAYLGRHGQRDVGEIMAKPVVPGAPLLRLAGVNAGYDGSEVLHGVGLEVREGEVVALLGRNGVGKTTTLRTIAGVLKPRSGRVEFAGTDITHLSPDRINHLGLSTVPEGRRIFPNLTVVENLLIAQRPGGWSLEEAYTLFPKLRVRAAAKGEHLSGGERQMLAIARALMAPTKLILLDEPFEGLAPGVVAEVLSAVSKLRGRCSILLVEHKLETILALASRIYVMVNGQIAHQSDTESLRGDEELQRRLLGVGA